MRGAPGEGSSPSPAPRPALGPPARPPGHSAGQTWAARGTRGDGGVQPLRIHARTVRAIARVPWQRKYFGQAVRSAEKHA